MTQKVGRITVAVSLVAFGMALLLDNLGLYVGALALVAKLWPAMLIGFGLEYLLYSLLFPAGGNDRRLRLDWGGAFLLGLIVTLSVGVTGALAWLPNFSGQVSVGLGIGPSASRTDSQVVQAGGAKELLVDVGMGSVALQEGARPGEIRVEAEYTANGFDLNDVRSRLEQIKLHVTEGESIKVAADVPSSAHNVSVHYKIYAPAGLKVRASTAAGRIEATGYKGDLTLTSTVGRIDVQGGGGSLNANSGSGRIAVKDFDGPVSARTNVGSLEMQNITGALQLDSGTGSITVKNYRRGVLVAETRTGRIEVDTQETLQGDVRLKTNTGSIKFDVPEQSSVQASAQTGTGSLSVPSFMSVSQMGTTRSAVGSSAGGKYTVSLEAGTGSVQFNAH